MLPVQTVPYNGQQAGYKPASTAARSIFQNNFALQNIMQNANFTHLQVCMAILLPEVVERVSDPSSTPNQLS